MSHSFYRAFEERHRGSRELIKARLRAYSVFVEPLTRLHHPARTLDLGCGRGEWLELLAESGFEARGVDLDDGMLAACRERALDVATTDALSALRALPDASLALVSAFHLVEHLPFDDVQLLIREALRLLRPGGLLIMETPNPENLTVGASDFYLDPSHQRPLPSPLLAFAVEFHGFARHTVLRLHETAGQRDGAPLGLIDVLDGVSRDYGVVAQKDGPAPELALFDAPFAAHYGLDLTTVARRYEQQLQRRLDEMSTRQRAQVAYTAALEARLAELGARVQSDVSTSQRALLASTAALEARLAELDARVRSDHVARFIAAYREGRILGGLRRRVLARLPPTVTGALERLLRPVSGRLVGGQAPASPAASAAPAASDDMLSPRASHTYHELEELLAKRA